MMVTFVSQCEKKSLPKTRRVLDAFANRIGNRTWQTVITEEGLHAVKKLLKKTASKNTAVSCHWIRSRSRSELLWVVGNKNKFNAEGIVPVNYTEKDISQFMDKNAFKTLPVIKYASAIAALFHDFGKANILFQKKLDPDPDEISENFEPYRHEWVSFRLFQTFVGKKTDEQWLVELSEIDKNNFPECYKDGLDQSEEPKLSDLAPFAGLVAWLIVTHHKLPVYPAWKEHENYPPDLKYIDEWLDQNFTPLWNSHNCYDEDQKHRVKENWQFADLPVQSYQWRSKACMLASEALVRLRPWLNIKTDWLYEELFSTHLSRLSLILADHFYSSLTIEEAKEFDSEQIRNRHYNVYANTDWVDGKKVFKQQLDEHLIGVTNQSEEITNKLTALNRSLESLEPSDELTENVGYDEPDKEKRKKLKEKFGWQDSARKLTEKIGKDTVNNGFFGINMASTGMGKTRANAKIMSALGLQTGRVRFSVALGLRVLTLQTGKEFQDELKLTEEELAIAVGGTAVKQLFENQQEKERLKKEAEKDQSIEATGSESQEEFTDPDMHVHYKGNPEPHSLCRWTKKQKGLDDLLNAPVLVSTIDHLIPATEGTKGGRQIPATLRLLTSDLVLDEPDDFGLEDLPALCRFVHWAGMLGSRILLSTATIPPALAYALYKAYRAGWKQFAKANLDGWTGEITCAWFDEKESKSEQCAQLDFFKKKHEQFVQKRIKYLKMLPAKRKAEIITVTTSDDATIAKSMGATIQDNAIKLHQAHCLSNYGKTLSVGLVRMANINQLVAVAKALLKKSVPDKATNIHYCIYHSRYPLAIRSSIENNLDCLLNRKKPDAIWKDDVIKAVLQNNPEIKHHIFIVLASPVAEVGRDHDYDWAIVEPSSMRSIIQLAGRILRHRDLVPETPNLLLLNKNYKALNSQENSQEICFTRPGFESRELKLEDHDLKKIMDEEQYQQITALQRITLPKAYRVNPEGKYENFIELEHKALAEQLFTGSSPAKVWWDKQSHWCGEVQRQQRFRKSEKDEAYYLWLESQYSDTKWRWKNEQLSPPEFGEPLIKINPVVLDELGAGNNFWFQLDALTVYQHLADDFGLDLAEVSRRFGEVRLTEYEGGNTEEYNYHPQLGVYQELSNNE